MKEAKFLLYLLLFLISGCKKEYDDSNLTKRIDGLEQRIQALEELCREMNTNISALQTIVIALQENDYITHIAPINNEGENIGYTITFAKNGSITIFHGKDGSQGADGVNGKDGADGHTPQIGVKKDVDGIYYWTLDGEWLTDEVGCKIKALGENGKDGTDGEAGKDGNDGEDGTPGKDGEDGKDGITPQLRIAEGYWEISYNNGVSWERLGKATGEDGKDGVDGKPGADGKDGEPGEDGKDGDSIFKEISEDEENVYFILADNTIITIPKVQQLNLVFEQTSGIVCFPGESVDIPYIIKGGDEKTTVECLGEGDWRGEVKTIDAKSGYVTVIAPAPIVAGKILVIVSDGKGQTITKMLSFVEGVLRSTSDYYQVDATAQTLTVLVTTNLDYTIYIPEEAQNWVSVAPMTRGGVREDECVLAIEALKGSADRQTDIEFRYKGEALQKVTIVQEAVLSADIIRFEDPEVKKFFTGKSDIYAPSVDLSVYDINKDGEISYQEAAVADHHWMVYFPTTASSFNEFQYFTQVKRVAGNDEKYLSFIINGHYPFKDNQNLESIVLPESVTVIEGEAFKGCSNLKSIHIPDGITSIEERTFEDCVILESIELPGNLIAIQNYAFKGCESLTAVSIPEQVTTIATGVFEGCSALESVHLPQKIERISGRAFAGCSRLKEISLPESVQYIGEVDGNTFSGCESLTSINIPRNTIYLGNNLFAGCTNLREVIFEEGIKGFSRNGVSIFRDCNQLKSVTLPSTLTSFSFEMFYNCEAEFSITFLSPEPPRLTSEIIGYIDWRTTKIYVPRESLELYKTADEWSLVAQIIYAIGE